MLIVRYVGHTLNVYGRALAAGGHDARAGSYPPTRRGCNLASARGLNCRGEHLYGLRGGGRMTILSTLALVVALSLLMLLVVPGLFGYLRGLAARYHPF